MALSDYMDNISGSPSSLTDQDKPFLDTLPQFVYKETLEPFTGIPKNIVFSDPIQYFDDAGLELIPRYVEKRIPPPYHPTINFLKG